MSSWKLTLAVEASNLDQTNYTLHQDSSQGAASLVRSLPKIDLPKFSGKHWDWENFRDVFNSIVDSRDEVYPIIKFYYLRTHLNDEALNKVKSLPITNENYDKAWNVLVDYYENKRRLAHAHLAGFFAGNL